jgi:hypothetical protein
VQPEAMLRDLLDAATRWQVDGCDGQAQAALINQISPQVRAKAEALGLAAVADPSRWRSPQGYGLLFKVGSGCGTMLDAASGHGSQSETLPGLPAGHQQVET